MQNALLANANTLLVSALALLDLGHIALARSVAILGLEESGKAVAVHERRVQMCRISEGEEFRSDQLDELWASHEKKLEVVHHFLMEEPYWFDVQSPDPDENATYLGTIKSWARRHDRSKHRGFYVDVGKTGEVMAPSDIPDESALREVIARVHQIGWQLRLGEHIEGQGQDAKEAGIPAMTDGDLSWLMKDDEDADPTAREFRADLERSIREGTPGAPLPNASYRFNPPGADRSPFRNLGKPGYEAETREIVRLAREVKEDRK